MGSQQTRELAESDMNNMESAVGTTQKFSNDVCFLIFSFINSAENTEFLVQTCSRVCRQWRHFVKQECGLKIVIRKFDKLKELKNKLSNGCLKYYNVSSLTLMCSGNVELKGKSIGVICKGANAHFLRELRLPIYVGCDVGSVKMIATTLTGLQVLDLSYNYLSNDSLFVLGQNEGMQNLKVLHIHGEFSDDAIFALTNSPYLKKLEEFYTQSSLSKESIMALMDTFKLKALEFKGRKENDEVFEYLSKTENISQLTYLSAKSETYYTWFESNIWLISQNPLLTNLSYLDISALCMEPEPMTVLFSSSVMSKIKTLIADSCEIKKEAATALASNPLIRNLTYLSLEKNNIGSGFEKIILSPIMKNVTYLNVGDNDPAIGSSGCLKIGSSEYLDNLTALNISKNKIDEFGLTGLTFGNMFLLQELNLSYNVFSNEGHQLIDDCIYLRLVTINKEGCKYVPVKKHPMK